jgi:hypothetical protein
VKERETKEKAYINNLNKKGARKKKGTYWQLLMEKG